MTRDPESQAAKALAALGAEVVAANLDDVASLERAFQGADAAFLVTFFWAHFSPEFELAHAENMAKAAKAAGVGHQPVRYDEVTPEVYRSFGFPGADDLGNMFQVKRDFETQYRAARDLGAARALVPSLQSFDTWLGEDAKRIPLS